MTVLLVIFIKDKPVWDPLKSCRLLVFPPPPMSWAPKRTLAESTHTLFVFFDVSDLQHLANAILCAPGSLHEIETRLVDGRLQRVYKNLWPSLRAFWIASVEQYAEETYIVFEEQRLTYRQTLDQAIKAAGLFRDVYGVSKGIVLSMKEDT